MNDPYDTDETRQVAVIPTRNELVTTEALNSEILLNTSSFVLKGERFEAV